MSILVPPARPRCVRSGIAISESERFNHPLIAPPFGRFGFQPLDLRIKTRHTLSYGQTALLNRHKAVEFMGLRIA
jgi:hypothetical protein